MKQKLILLFLLIVQFSFSQENSKIDLSSVDAFFTISKKIASNEAITNSQWEYLFNTKGYKISAKSELRKEVVKNMMIFAFDEHCKQQKDSILKIDVAKNLSNPNKFLSKLTLDNFLRMKNKMDTLQKFRNEYDFNDILLKSKNKLHNFLLNPVDSLIKSPKIAMLCHELDAQAKSDGIVIDFNLFYERSKQNLNISFLAHEMFHIYRNNYENKELINSSNLLIEINKVQNEGIADLIDKTLESLVENLQEMEYPQAIIDMYVSTYSDTPNKLEKMDSITKSFLKNEITEKEFNAKFKNFFIFGGHPNGLYMTEIIKKAGYVNELKKYFYSPIDFIKTYNKAAKKENVYVFSSEFVDYLNRLDAKYNIKRIPTIKH